MAHPKPPMPNNEDENNAPLSWKPAHQMSPEELEQFRKEAAALGAESPHGMTPEQKEQRKKEIMAKLPPFEGKLSDVIEVSHFVTMSDEEIDQFILDNLSGKAIMKDVGEGDEFAPRQYAMDMFPPGDDHQVNRAAVEARLTQVLVLQPLKKEIERVKEELQVLEQTPGIEPGDERLLAKQEELADLYQDLSQCELRLEANKETMQRAARRNRVAPLTEMAKAEKEGLESKVKEPNRVKVQDKPEDLREENMEFYKLPRLIDASVLVLEGVDLDRKGFPPLQASPSSIADAYKSEFKARLTRKRTQSPEALPEEIQDELKVELAQDAELKVMVGEVVGMMQPVVDELNLLQKQRSDLSQKREEKKEALAHQLAADPSLIEDAEVRSRAEGARAALLEAEAGIQQCDEQLAALENPDEQAEAAAIQQYGSVEEARTHWKNEKKQAVQQRASAEGALYSAVNSVIGPIFENDPETLSINAQIEELKGQQSDLIQQYKKEKTAEAAAIREERKDHRVVVGGEVADVMEANGQVVPDDGKTGVLKPSGRVEQNAGTALKLQEEELRRSIDQAPYQQYLSNVETAVHEFKMRPEIIPDPAKREQGMALKQQMAELQAKVAQYDKEVAKLEQGKVGALLRSLASGGTEGRKEFYAQKKAAALEELASLEKQLDDVAHEAVSVSIKQDLLNAVMPPAQAKVAAQDAAHSNDAVAVDQSIQPEAELLANAPSYPAPPPPGPEMSKKPKVNISSKSMDAGDGMPVAPPQQEGPNIALPDAEEPQHGHDVRSALKPAAAIETNSAPLSNAADHAESANRHKSTVGEMLHHDQSNPKNQAGNHKVFAPK